ncbi:MAG TPA: MarR family transcriptional regulator [Dehalococcoidales bacterium]
MDNSRTYTEISHKVWELLQHTNALLLKYADVKLIKERGISYQQFMVLYMMDRIGKSAGATQIAELLARSPNTLSTILDRMEKGRLVKKVRDAQDRRFVRLVMTKKGKNKLEKAIESGQAIIEQLAASFSEEELQTFATLIEKLLKQTYEVLVPRKVAKRMGFVNSRGIQPDKKRVATKP